LTYKEIRLACKENRLTCKEIHLACKENQLQKRIFPTGQRSFWIFLNLFHQIL
jgi:hypothetical protein